MKMSTQQIINFVEEACNEFEDGETGVHKCLELYCEEYDATELDIEMMTNVYDNEMAVLHGVPRSVVEGNTKLTDHFSKEYIDSQCNIKK